MGDYELGWQNLIDLAMILLVFLLISFYFIRKKNLKPLAIFFPLYTFYIAIIFLDFVIGIPFARYIITLTILSYIVFLIVIYQADLRSSFFNLFKNKHEKGFSTEKYTTDDDLRVAIDEIVRACQTMSKTRTGALIIIATTTISSHILETGTELGALISAPLLESIFNTKGPLHDGAVVVKGNRILAAGCFLPLSESTEIAKNLGTRHRAGIGITEGSDILTIILSEETGVISTAKDGKISRFITSDRLKDKLSQSFNLIAPKKMRN
ncbi:MAG: diadenylate cyclase [Christensenellaceae bacterium]|jgi:diadenylate cyclase|nr:diadenylate cyclase [Christensenellaceae bacterium]